MSRAGRVARVLFWLGLLGSIYVGFELGVRLLAPEVMEVTVELDAGLDQARERGSISAYVAHQSDPSATKEYLDAELGWDREPQRYASCDAACDDPFRVLLIGDSVTAGHNVRTGAEDYGYLLSLDRHDRPIEIINAGVGGYGVYQMSMKTRRALQTVEPDLIIFSYIAHDLIRPGRSFIYLKTRPSLALGRRAPLVQPPADLERFLRNYEVRKNTFSTGPWFVGFLWDNRRYYAPYLFRRFFAQVFDHVVSEVATLAREANAELAFVMLPQRFNFRHRDELTALMNEALIARRAAAEHPFHDVQIQACVEESLAGAGLSLSVMTFHPPPAGHRAYADCLREMVIGPLIRSERRREFEG